MCHVALAREHFAVAVPRLRDPLPKLRDDYFAVTTCGFAVASNSQYSFSRLRNSSL
jgi:hypothetical protein